MGKKVLVSGCFDLLHSGHIAFLEEASSYGELYVALGSDETVNQLKGSPPINSQEERLYMVKSIRFVKDAFISRGSGMLDFLEEFNALKPDVFVVNEDGNTAQKSKLCRENKVTYIVLKREPKKGLQPRSTTFLRRNIHIPFRIDLAGGWLDQPFVSKFHPGSVITISIEATHDFNERSGMASSTRTAAIDLWGPRLPSGDPEKNAKILFSYDNPPGTNIISGSQDAIGIVFSGLAKSFYKGEYWPERIDRIFEQKYLEFVEESLFLVSLGPRKAGFNVLENTQIDSPKAQALADATDVCWDAIRSLDIAKFGEAIRIAFEAQIAMFPNMMNQNVNSLINQYRNETLGWKLSGAGGGGYLILVSSKPIENAIKITARRPGI
jgi:cytidyltransferase-like protein